MNSYHVSINGETRSGVISVGSDNQVKGDYHENSPVVERTPSQIVARTPC